MNKMNKNNNRFEIVYSPEKHDGASNSRGEHFLYSGCRILSSFGSNVSSNLGFFAYVPAKGPRRFSYSNIISIELSK
tara:strand:- start:3696 stop:3926 length:231 start_codon:yes stop_codon:yes gene_type:complete